MRYSKTNVDGIQIFYGESENSDKPIMVLFHGFPSASHMFRDLMPLLEDKYHLIAPDYPGFGQSDSPSRELFTYAFDQLAEVMDRFLQALHIDKFYMYVFDYGAPIGFRIAMKHPLSIFGIVSQNGNVYEEGLGKKWEARAEYWQNPTHELREQYKSAFSRETVPGIPGIPAEIPAKGFSYLRKGGSIVHLGRRRGFCKRPAGCQNCPCEKRTFCAGKLLCRNCREYTAILLRTDRDPIKDYELQELEIGGDNNENAVCFWVCIKSIQIGFDYKDDSISYGERHNGWDLGSLLQDESDLVFDEETSGLTIIR